MLPIQRIATVALQTLACLFALPAAAQEPRGDNCEVLSAPESAGEIFFVIGKVSAAGRVYPRLSEIPANYTGCQTLWVSMNGGPVARTTTSFVGGRVVSVHPVPDGIPLCMVGEKAAQTGCTPRREVVQASFPAGCAARTVALKVMPEDCWAAFDSEYKLLAAVGD